jgi:hypothetical protein
MKKVYTRKVGKGTKLLRSHRPTSPEIGIEPAAALTAIVRPEAGDLSTRRAVGVDVVTVQEL